MTDQNDPTSLGVARAPADVVAPIADPDSPWEGEATRPRDQLGPTATPPAELRQGTAVPPERGRDVSPREDLWVSGHLQGGLDSDTASTVHAPRERGRKRNTISVVTSTEHVPATSSVARV